MNENTQQSRKSDAPPIFIHPANDHQSLVLLVSGVEVARHRSGTVAYDKLVELSHWVRAAAP